MNNSIPVHCHTNLDAYQRETFPRAMAVRPMIGDRVESISGKTLRIVDITHKTTGASNNDPCLYIELHN